MRLASRTLLAGGGLLVAALGACSLGRQSAGPESGGTVAPPPSVAGTVASPTGTIPGARDTPLATGPERSPSQDAAPVFGYEVIRRYPHDGNAFTQGLEYRDGGFYEGTGIYGESTLRKVALDTGAVLQSIDLESRYFGEGITLWDDRIIQITWKERTAIVYNRDTFTRTGQFTYETEGWGLTHDDTRLIMSDGSARLTFRNPDTFEVLGQVEVTDAGLPIDHLNELEYIDGEVWANIWLTDRIVIIDPESGAVNATVDLAGLLPVEDRLSDSDVLNGIAYDAGGKRLFLTGKKWPALFEVKLVPPRTSVISPSLLPMLIQTRS